jgi:hypothetical protein
MAQGIDNLSSGPHDETLFQSAPDVTCSFGTKLLSDKRRPMSDYWGRPDSAGVTGYVGLSTPSRPSAGYAAEKGCAKAPRLRPFGAGHAPDYFEIDRSSGVLNFLASSAIWRQVRRSE